MWTNPKTVVFHRGDHCVLCQQRRDDLSLASENASVDSLGVIVLHGAVQMDATAGSYTRPKCCHQPLGRVLLVKQSAGGRRRRGRPVRRLPRLDTVRTTGGGGGGGNGTSRRRTVRRILQGHTPRPP